jgi:hypothetical protein
MEVDGTTLSPQVVGEQYARRLVERLNSVAQPLNDVRYGGSLKLMNRPKEQHTAPAILFDERPHGLDISWMPDFPLAFAVGLPFVDGPTATGIGHFVTDIPFGQHGLAENLTPGKPLHLVGIARTRETAERLHEELRALRQDRGRKEAKRIKTSVVVPR